MQAAQAQTILKNFSETAALGTVLAHTHTHTHTHTQYSHLNLFP
jgi:hypothetical protein